MHPIHFNLNSLVRLFGRFAGPATGILFGAIMGCVSQPQEIDPYSDPLMAPTLESPLDGRTYRYPPAGLPPMVELIWRHGMPTADVPSPHQAERFIVCVYDEERGRCESGSRRGVPQPIWFEAAADDPVINRAPIEQERPPFASPLDIQLGYEFRASLRMRPEYRARSLLWQVGACLSGTCRLSEPRSLQVGRIAEPIGI